MLRPDASAASASAAIEVADDADCELGQGWRFSKPLAPGAFAQWVRTGERARADAATAPAPQGTPAPAGNPSGA